MFIKYYSGKICGVRSTVFHTWVNEELNGTKEYFSFEYNYGKGKFNIDTGYLICVANQKDFRKIVGMFATNNDPNTLAGYLNFLLKTVYNRFNTYMNDEDPDKRKILEYLEKKNAILAKDYKVSPLKEVSEKTTDNKGSLAEKIVNDIVESKESHELMTDLKRCNVFKLVPTQVNPFWENCKIDLRIGYSLEYRGLKLNVITDKGWVKNDYKCNITIIDPVIGLPITSYVGTLSELEEVISQKFIPYLQTLDSNKESIVQIAHAFKKLKNKAITVA